MEKMCMETPDMVSENIKKIETLFPNCITEISCNCLCNYNCGSG